MEVPTPGGGDSASSAGRTTGAWSSSSTTSAGGGHPESAAARGRGGTGAAGVAAAGAASGEQKQGDPRAAMAGRRSRRRVEGELSAFPSPPPFPASSRDQLLTRGSYSAANAATVSASHFTRPDFPPPIPAWGHSDRRLASRGLPPPSAPRNPAAAPLPKTTATFDGLPQSFGAGPGPSTGLGVALGMVLGSAPAAGRLFDASTFAGASRERAALGYAEERVPQPVSQGGTGSGGGGGGGGRVSGSDGAGMARGAAAAAWTGGNVENPSRNLCSKGGDSGWEGGTRGGADTLLRREGAQQRDLEYSDSDAPAASSPAAAFMSTASLGAAAHHHEQHRHSSTITAADSRGVNRGVRGVGNDSGPSDALPPASAPDL